MLSSRDLFPGPNGVGAGRRPATSKASAVVSLRSTCRLGQWIPGTSPGMTEVCVAIARPLHKIDRKSVVSGTSVSVRVDLGGRRIITKKQQLNAHRPNTQS